MAGTIRSRSNIRVAKAIFFGRGHNLAFRRQYSTITNPTTKSCDPAIIIQSFIVLPASGWMTGSEIAMSNMPFNARTSPIMNMIVQVSNFLTIEHFLLSRQN